jgi:hypothetical protein
MSSQASSETELAGVRSAKVGPPGSSHRGSGVRRVQPPSAHGPAAAAAGMDFLTRLRGRVIVSDSSGRSPGAIERRSAQMEVMFRLTPVGLLNAA